MRKSSINTSWLLPLVGSFVLGVPAIATAVLGNQDPQQPESYSSTTHDHPIPSTADQPKMPSSDRTIEQKTREAIYADKGLSAAAHHVKIVAQDGKVTLHGSVRSGRERSNIFTKAAAVAGEGNVINKIEVMPSKQ
jgi:osmotically-inducible protein OsmY